ncbi:uncharacterized protein LOC108672601 [Hyalella azteca]|uniref:Uncharacterized protein LOC108672601 n=1 Tax=Hyalella azteca TaxID=294128 RepID=A0A979FS37_HYAAZ|nr:uncharacterized protein LOC108672601 [Hyalella azteca]
MVPDYDIVVPTLSSPSSRWTRSVPGPSSRWTRSVPGSSAVHQQQLGGDAGGDADPLHLTLDALGQTFSFKLEESRGLVSPLAALVHRYHNRSDVGSLAERRDCLYTGRRRDTSIAVNICSHMRGVIRSPTDELIIEPLPDTALRRHRRSTRREEIPLLIHRRSRNPPCSSTQGEGGHDREYLISRFQSESLFNRPVPRITDLSSGLSNSADNDLFVTGGSRQKLPAAIYVETAVFVDKDLAEHMENYFPTDSEEQLVQVVLAMVNAVQLLYTEKSLGVEVHFIIKRLEVLHEDPVGLHRPHDIDIYLTNFCRWQRDENPVGDDHALHWDHALVLTGLDLYTVTSRGRLNSQVVGLAPVAGMCSASSSCTVNEGRHFESVYVVAHEIGHNLGMRHDGATAGNNCDPGEHLMSPTLGSGKITWSTCSRRYLEIFLSSDQSGCLRDAAEATPELDHRGELLPGQRFPADMQCMLKHGPGSRHADTQPLQEICEDLHCRRDHYTWTSHPALEGTSCGPLKWCKHGRCLKQTTRSRDSQKISSVDRRPSTNNFFDSRRGEHSPPIAGIDLLDPQPSIPAVLGSLPPSDGSIVVRFTPGPPSLTPFTRIPDPFSPSGPIASITPVPPSVLPPSGDGDWSECQSSCLYGTDGMLSSGSIGIQKSRRSCSTCRGQFRYRTCSAVRQCAAGSRRTLQDFADQACRALVTDNPRYSGLATTISPNGLSQCRVTCATVSLGADVSRTWYPDGTTCYLDSGSAAYCIAGVCTGFSCNPDSQFISSGVHCQSSQTISSITDLTVNLWGPWTAGSSCRFQREVSQLSGVGMQLSNTASDPDRACTVACQDLTLHYRFYRVNGRDGWFPFGTDCSGGQTGRPKHCLNGKCLDFDVEGIPLQLNEVSAVGPRSRSLDLEAVAEDAVEIQPLLPLRTGALKPTPLPFYSFQEQQVMMHKQLINQHLRDQHPLQEPLMQRNTQSGGALLRRSLQKRDIKLTSHRLPGSIDSQFLMTLVDQLNYTMTYGNDSKLQFDSSTIDLANPIFIDVSVTPSNSSHAIAKHRWTTRLRSNDSNATEIPAEIHPDKKFSTSQESAVEDGRKLLEDFGRRDTETMVMLTDPYDSEPPFQAVENVSAPQGSWPKKTKETAMLLSVDGQDDTVKHSQDPMKDTAQNRSLSSSRGRSLDSASGARDSYLVSGQPSSVVPSTEIAAEQEEGFWDVKKTPCSVTCGEGLLEVVVTCQPAASSSRGLSKESPLIPRHDQKLSFIPQITDTKTLYGQPVPFSIDSKKALGSFSRHSRVYHLERGEPEHGIREPISTRNQEKIHRWYHIIIEDPGRQPHVRNDDFRPSGFIGSHPLRTQIDVSLPNVQVARSSLLQDSNRRVPNRPSLPSPSFSSNSQLRDIVHPKHARSIDFTVQAANSKVPCSGPMPEVPGFQKCVLRECPLEEHKPSPVLSAWLTSLMARSQNASKNFSV